MGGISPSRRTPNVLLFSDPATGKQHGYHDEWRTDGCFHYTGEGQRGDQEMRAGNAAILNHISEGRALRVFDGTGGVVTYIDEFEIDADEPFYRTDAEAKGGEIREVIMFRLHPKQIDPPEPDSKLALILAGPVNLLVPIEQQHTEKAYVAPSKEPYETERRENRLVLEFENYLLDLNHDVSRNQLIPSGEARPLLTDLYDATIDMLVEAKGTAERNAIRMAIGQLADYKRFFKKGSPKRLAVLLPREPRKDLHDLLSIEGIDVIYQTQDGFEDSTGGALVGR